MENQESKQAGAQLEKQTKIQDATDNPPWKTPVMQIMKVENAENAATVSSNDLNTTFS